MPSWLLENTIKVQDFERGGVRPEQPQAGLFPDFPLESWIFSSFFKKERLYIEVVLAGVGTAYF